jgi:hypothetical protein
MRRPRVSLVLTLMLLSLAGIPITAGFVSKFYVAALFEAGECGFRCRLARAEEVRASADSWMLCQIVSGTTNGGR